jgi:hypothetical protein
LRRAPLLGPRPPSPALATDRKAVPAATPIASGNSRRFALIAIAKVHRQNDRSEGDKRKQDNDRQDDDRQDDDRQANK